MSLRVSIHHYSANLRGHKCAFTNIKMVGELNDLPVKQNIG